MKLSEMSFAKKTYGPDNVDDMHDLYGDMYDDLSVQTLIGDIRQALKTGVSWDYIEANIEDYEEEAQTELTSEEREALFFVLQKKER